MACTHGYAINTNLIASVFLQREIDARTGKSSRLVLVRATEAHLLAKEIAEAGVGVILIPARMFPATWEQRRILPGPPLTPQSAIGVLMAANVTVGVGIEEEWQARNQRFDLAWVRAFLPYKCCKAHANENCIVFIP